MKNIDKIIKESIYNVLKEVRYIDSPWSQRGKGGKVNTNRGYRFDNQEPIKKGEKIRVYHGCALSDAIKIAKEGLSGEMIASRNYSYEYGMNPSGLFVTTDFYQAKEFGFHYESCVIIEFTANIDDLDCPVWNGQGTFFGQNTNPQPFINRGDRVTQRMDYEDTASNSEFDYIRNSDNKGLADKIFNNSECQALFYGDLSPNMIKRFWVGEYENGKIGQYKPMNLAEFLHKYANHTYRERRHNGEEYDKKITTNKIFYPTEDISSPYDVAERLIHIIDNHGTIKTFSLRKKAFQKDIDGIVSDLNHYIDVLQDPNSSGHEIFYIKHTLNDLLFPRQIIQLIGSEAYRMNFNKFYPQQFRCKGKYGY